MEIASVMMEFSTNQGSHACAKSSSSSPVLCECTSATGSLAPGDTVDWEVRALTETPEPTLLVHIKARISLYPAPVSDRQRQPLVLISCCHARIAAQGKCAFSSCGELQSGIVEAPGKSDSGRRELETLRTKNWVQRVIVGMKVCDFSKRVSRKSVAHISVDCVNQ
jgi:hypothetical protein